MNPRCPMPGILVIALPILWFSAGAAADESCLSPLLQTAQHPRLQRSDFSAYREPVQDFYREGGYRLQWWQGGRPTPRAVAVMDLLVHADGKGLDPEDYDAALWREPPDAPDTDCGAARLDLALTVSAVRYVSDLRLGRVDPQRVSFDLDVESKRFEPVRLLQNFVRGPDPKPLLEGVEPPFRRYRALLQALARYRELALDEELNRPLPVPPAAVRPGDAYADLEGVVYRLQRWGDLPDAQAVRPVGAVYSDGLAEAVKRFQMRHGLLQDGVMGKDTFAQLNVPMRERVDQIRFTLERWRWLPDELGHRPVVINVPQYKLYAFENDRELGLRLALEMDVIVGEAYPRHQTPLFRAGMRYIVFSPYWNVPYRIMRKELYPKIEKDPAYLEEHHYELVEAFHPGAMPLPDTPENLALLQRGGLKLRQRPGADNALGQVKFMFPNVHSVYLHGTPALKLFGKDKRDFSHGCIRVLDPPRLAEHVLSQEKGWDRARIDELIASGEWTQVNLSQALDVYILYGTAVAELDGTVYFFRDVYGHDERLAQVLAERSEGIRDASAEMPRSGG